MTCDQINYLIRLAEADRINIFRCGVHPNESTEAMRQASIRCIDETIAALRDAAEDSMIRATADIC